MRRAQARLLILAGSDSGGGAGLQADIKTATALGVYAATAVTAVTVQDTCGVRAVHEIPAAIVRDQIACVLDDIGADAVKIGMLSSSAIVGAVAQALESGDCELPIVLDPVFSSTSGTALLEENALSALKERLLPLATLLTPNIPEAERLTGVVIRDSDDMSRAGEKLRALGSKAVLVKGGHAAGDTIEDVFVDSEGVRVFSSPRIDSQNTHGTGCTLATAIACGLAQGRTQTDSVERARLFVQRAMETAPNFGRGRGPLNHLHGIARD